MTTETPIEAGANPSLFGVKAVSQLESYEQRDLLDAIDKLRRAYIPGPDFGIPQIVVCGDQSSGKSSVLEAIAQVRFPIGSQTTTRLPTEVVLRNTPVVSRAPIELTIRAGSDRGPEERAHINKFSTTVDTNDPKGFSSAVTKAEEHLRQQERDKKFWYDRLHVEISGPTQPNLTLVDLPGLIQSEVDSATRGDKEKIRDLVKSYISKPKTIVLAVVSALYDIDNQEVIQLVKDAENATMRTIGVLTKPDRVDKGSDDEKRVVLFARNKKIHLGLGWHVLRNLPHELEDRSYDVRDEAERECFSQGVWLQMDRDDVGISALREKLSVSLMSCITQDLPEFIALMQGKFGEYERRSAELGPGRDSVESQRDYLNDIQEKLDRLIQVALEGGQEHSEFASFFDGSPEKGLRATINRLNTAYSERMRFEGKQFHIFGKPDERNNQLQDHTLDANIPNFYAPYTQSAVEPEPRSISLQSYCHFLAIFADETRGTGLPRLLAPGTMTAIFRQQSVFWKSITTDYVDECYASTLDFVNAAVVYVAGKFTGQKLMHAFIDRFFTIIRDNLRHKLEELLWPYRESHPATLNPKYGARVNPSNHLSGSQEDQTEAFTSWTKVAHEQNFEDGLVFAAEALDKTEAYYDLALDTFVDNVSILGIEAVLLRKLRSLLPAKIVRKLGDERLGEIATEPPGAQQKRETINGQIAVLDEVIQTFPPEPLGAASAKTVRDRHSAPVRNAHDAIHSAKNARSQLSADPRQPSGSYGSRTTVPSANMFRLRSSTNSTDLLPGVSDAAPVGSYSGPFGPFGGFGSSAKPSPSSSLFGSNANPSATSIANLNLGSRDAATPGSTSSGFGGFGSSAKPSPSSGLFGNNAKSSATGIAYLDLGSRDATTPGSSSSLFGIAKPNPSSGLFGSTIVSSSTSGSKSGGDSTPALGTGLFQMKTPNSTGDRTEPHNTATVLTVVNRGNPS